MLPILLDVGTDNPALRDDPLYVGWRHARVRGAEYDAFVETFVAAVAARWPGVLLQWEDFAGANAWRLLHRYRDRLLSFNDDIQGTAATAVGAVLAAVARTGRPLSAQRVVIVGAGAAGMGIAALLVDAMVGEGMDRAAATRAIWAMDRDGVVVTGQPGLGEAQAALARDPAEVAGWDTRDLTDVIVRVRPTILIGTSGQPGAFTKAAVCAMAAGVERPIIFPLSNPVSHCEAHPGDLLDWTDGRAIVGTGSPFGIEGVAQVNNVYVFPGIGLGALASGARRIGDGMFLAAARALAAAAPADGPGLLPPLTRLRETALAVARAVAEAAVADGDAPPRNDGALEPEMWVPAYD